MKCPIVVALHSRTKTYLPNKMLNSPYFWSHNVRISVIKMEDENKGEKSYLE